jgi:hypothetical protein
LAGLGLAGAFGCEDRPATWVYISAGIVQPACATSRCHVHSSAAAGLQLDTVEGGYLALVGAPPPQNSVPPLPPATPPATPPMSAHHVVPGHPESSVLMFRLRGQGVRKMPPDEPLPDADLELIERWILEGALYDR